MGNKQSPKNTPQEGERDSGGRELTLSDRSPFPHIVLITICLGPTTLTAAVAWGDAWAEQGGQLQRLVDHLRRRRLRPRPAHPTSFIIISPPPSPSSSFFTPCLSSLSFLSRASLSRPLAFFLFEPQRRMERAGVRALPLLLPPPPPPPPLQGRITDRDHGGRPCGQFPPQRDGERESSESKWKLKYRWSFKFKLDIYD